MTLLGSKAGLSHAIVANVQMYLNVYVPSLTRKLINILSEYITGCPLPPARALWPRTGL